MNLSFFSLGRIAAVNYQNTSYDPTSGIRQQKGGGVGHVSPSTETQRVRLFPRQKLFWHQVLPQIAQNARIDKTPEPRN